MDTNANRSIGMKLQEIRLVQGLTQFQLAERLSKPQSYISKIETGERGLHLCELFAYSRALGIEPQEIVSTLESMFHTR